jgi:hypothetical protein
MGRKAAVSSLERPTTLRPLAAAMGSYMLCGIPIFIYMADVRPMELSQETDDLFDNGQLVVLEPETWIGKPFPLTPHLTSVARVSDSSLVGQAFSLSAPSSPLDLSTGRWTVLMYHHDCPKCQEALPEYMRLADELQTRGDDRDVLLLEVPPFGNETPTPSTAAHARLSDTREWFVQSPVEVRIDNGLVTLAALDLPSISGAEQ